MTGESRGMVGRPTNPKECYTHPGVEAVKVFHWHPPGGDVFEPLCGQCAAAAEAQGFILEDIP